MLRGRLFWLAFALVFTSFILFYLIVLPEAPHSEGLMMISDIGEKILGVDFARREFIYPLSREEKILPFVSIIKQDFFPYLKLKIFSFEIPILWKEYHGGLLAWIFKILDKLFFFLGDFLRAELKIFLFHSLFSFLFLYFIFKLLQEHFFVDRFIIYSLIFFTLTCSIFYFFRATLHHAQAGIFILGLCYFLMKKRYVLSGLFAGLAVYSYLPIIFAVLGFALASLLYHKNFRGVFFIALFSITFSLPHLYYIFSSQNETFNYVYSCSNCVGLFPPSGLKYHLKEQIGFYELFKILVYLLFSLILLPVRIQEILGFAFSELKESFSVSDVMMRYGILVQYPPLKYISDIGIILNLFYVLFFGLFYIKGKFEFIAYFSSIIFYVFLSRYFMLLPKMIYFLCPIYILLAVRVLNEFFFRKQKILAFVFVVSSILRLAEFVQLGKNVRGVIDLKTNLEVINFFKDKDVRSDEILLYCLPPAFKIFTNGKLNPPVFLPIFEKMDEHVRRKTVEFVIEHTTFKYIVLDNLLIRYVYDIIYDKKLDLNKIDLKIVFRNGAFSIIKVTRYDNKK